MLSWRFLLPDQVQGTFEHAKDFLPDNLRNIQSFALLYTQKDSLFLEIGAFQGVFWFTRIIPGWQADVHVNLWDDEVRKQYATAKRFVQELAYKLKLRRVNAYIPAHNENALKYAVRVGFQQEGVIHYGDFYDEKLRDIYIFGLFGEDLNGI